MVIKQILAKSKMSLRILFIGAVLLNVASSTIEFSDTKRLNEQSAKPLNQDPFTVVIGQDKTFTSYNFYRPRVGQFGTWGDLGQPAVFDAVSSGNRAYTHILAQGDQEGYGISDVGVLFDVVENPYGTWLMDASVSITFSYTLGVELNIPPPPAHGSGHAKIGVGGLTPFVEIDYISLPSGTHSIHRSGRVTETQAISLSAGNTYQIWANAYSDSVVGIANYADSYAEVTVEEIKVTFITEAVYTVDTVVDENDGSCSDDDCSLRDAIILANNPGPNTINFDTSVFPLSSPATINILSSLPSIGSDTVIDGSNAGVILDGSGTPEGTRGLVIDGASNVMIKGLQILNFPSDGIVLQNGASNNTVGGTNATPGGACSGDCNLISGNGTEGGSAGVNIQGSDTMNNTFSGNYIGTDASGTLALGNIRRGVMISDAQWNIIGGDTPGERNLISGNNPECVFDSALIIGYDAMNNTVKGNYIGTDASGTSALPNCAAVDIRSEANYNVISDNLISGNEGIGVTIRRGAMHNVIIGNKIGTDVNGTSALPNWRGFRIAEGAQYNVIGGDTPSERNIISGNRTCGVTIGHRDPSWGPSMNNTVSGNYIGTDISGTSPIGNVESGITIGRYAQYNITGGATPGERNIISGNGGEGVLIKDTEAMSNTISGNYIGTDASGTAALPNADDGIEITDGASYNVIGGATPGEGNVISGNGGHGVYVEGNGTIRNTVTKNAIYSNGGKGIELGNGGNLELSPPILTDVSTNAIEGQAPPNSTVEIFSDAEDEGRYFHGSTAADASGNFAFAQADPFTGANVTATATDGDGNTSEFSALYFKVPVLLVHGYCSDEGMWGLEKGEVFDFKKALEDQGFLVETIDLVPKPTNDSIWNYGSQLFGKITEIKEKHKVDQVDIVAHSLGGLAARAYAWQNSQRRDVRTLIMLGTPNSGSGLLPTYWPFLRSVLIAYGLPPWVGAGEAAEQMSPPSPFLRDLNNAGRQLSIENYYTVAGSKEIPLLSLFLEWPNDGVVEVSSVHSLAYATRIEAPVNHLEYDDDSYVFDTIVQILHGMISTAVPSIYVQQSGPDLQKSVLIEDLVGVGDENDHLIPIDSTVSEAHFVLASDGGELDFTLTTPGGTLITPAIAASNPLITYTNVITTLIGYDVVSPGQGNWTAHVAISGTASSDVSYAMLALLESELSLSILLDENVYHSNDPVPLAAQLMNASDPITEATVTAQIEGPGGSTQVLSLYDDGSHGDAQANDGIYSNLYTGTGTTGVYEVTVTASGMIYEGQFVRETAVTLWVEQRTYLPIILKSY
jgi:CSLREA domain-containing protein